MPTKKLYKVPTFAVPKGLPTFETTLSNGRVLVLRQALAQDIMLADRKTEASDNMGKGILLLLSLSAQSKNPLTEEEIMTSSPAVFEEMSEFLAVAMGGEEDSDPLEEE